MSSALPPAVPPDRCLVVLGASPDIARTATSLGCRVVFVQQPGSPVERIVDDHAHHYSVDFTGPAFPDFVDTVLRPLRPDAVVSVTEYGLRPAAFVNERLGLRGTPARVVELLSDKAATRERLHAAGHPTVRFTEVEDGRPAAETMRRWDSRSGVVLKPRRGTGSLGVLRFTDPAELAAVGPLPGYLMEEFIDGPEFSAETFSVGGAHQLVAVTEKHTSPSFVELAHVVPPRGLGPQDVAVVAEEVGAFLDAVGLSDGPAHTEFKYVDGHVRVIESHNRVGGDGIANLVRLVTGINLKKWSLGWALGLTRDDCRVDPEAAAAAVAFLSAPPGTVTDARLPLDLSARPGVLFARLDVVPGDAVGATGGSGDRVGTVAATGPDAHTALSRAQLAVEEMTVDIR
ncbi:ATP-grasp domain-containing protein [Streptomyces sp. R44]|uniref:ATP-grasp domain-containing protein n=1 Tax=Streptomyces sp. R44 TaxID=3238633 RepID=A0AB39TCP2_9ACTN